VFRIRSPHRSVPTSGELDVTHKTKPELASRVRRCWVEMLDRLAAMLGESGSNTAPRDARAAGRR